MENIGEKIINKKEWLTPLKSLFLIVLVSIIIFVIFSHPPQFYHDLNGLGEAFVLLILMWGLGALSIILGIRFFKAKTNKTIAVLLILVGICYLIPNSIIAMKTGIEKVIYHKDFVEQARHYVELDAMKANSDELTRKWAVAEKRAEEITRAHFDSYQNYFSELQILTKNYFGGTFLTKSGLQVAIFFNTKIMDFKDPIQCNREPTICQEQKDVINSILNKQVKLKLPNYEIFREQYISENELVSKVLNLHDEENKAYEDPLNPIWQKSLRIPVDIYYNGDYINSKLN